MTHPLLFESLYSEDLYHILPRMKIVITQPWVDLKQEEREQLSKIIGALKERINPKLGIEAFEIVQVESLDLSTWHERPAKLIYFGPAVKGLLNYEVIEARDTKMVLSETLAHLISSDGSRAKLWSALKQLFAD